MRWTERQQTLLQAMGLQLWLPPGATAAVTPSAPAPAPAPAPAASAASALATRPPAPSAAVAQPRPTPAAPLVAREPAPAVARAAAPADTLDWPDLHAAVSACQACGLCEGRTQTVFGVGQVQAHCMVVGEAPGEQEDRHGEPFVGPAGQLLDRMLAALGLTRGEAEPARQVFITNTLKCRPPRNRNPSPDELAACLPYLERQVALVQPRVILAMGRFAVTQLIGSAAPIGPLRGQVHQWRGVPVVVTYHPAYLLRQPADKAKAWDDLCLAAELLGR